MSSIDRILVIVTLVSAVWWAISRRRRPTSLATLSVSALVLALGTFAFEGLAWQLVPWQLLAVAVAAVTALRHWRPGRSRRWSRVGGRAVVVIALVSGGVALLTAVVPTMPRPSGPHNVGSEIFRWTDEHRLETFTADSLDHRQVIAQAWYPTDARRGPGVPYFEAQGRLPGSITGLPSFMFASFSRIDTHAISGAPVSGRQRAWPVLLFSPGLSIPREQYTALCADLASRGFVVLALSVPYESSVTVLAGDKIVGQTFQPEVMGPPPHPALERLIGVRAADAMFALDQLGQLAQREPTSPIAGHLDLGHVGIIGHSLGGATALQVMASDPRFKVGINLDGKLFGKGPEARLNRPFLWIQSDVTQTREYTEGRDRFFAREGNRGALLTIRKSMHLGFTDDPSYLTSLGRHLLGTTAGMGTLSLADMTTITADAISAFAGPPLGVRRAHSMEEVVAAHPGVRAESPVRHATGALAASAHVRLAVPAPTGPMRVGTQSLALTDRARREPAAASRPRSLVVQMWYPAAAGHRRAPYVSPAVAAYLASSAGVAPALLESVKLDATADAPPLARSGGWPVLIFSPGFGVERGLYAGLVEDLASHGYVVVAIDHPHDASVVEFPDGHVVRSRAQMEMTAALSVRVADTRFVLTELARIDRIGFFADLLDLGRVGMFGHSLGGAAAASVMLVDKRIDAGADLDGVLCGAVRLRGLSRPFMLMSGDPGFAADPNRAGFWSRLRGPHYAVDFESARHFAFSDLVFLAPDLIQASASAGQEIRALVGNVQGETTLAAERAYLLAFFDRSLRAKSASLLTNTPGPFADVRLTVGQQAR